MSGVIALFILSTPSAAAGHARASFSPMLAAAEQLASPPGAAEQLASPPAAADRSGSWLWPVPSHTPVKTFAAPPTRYAAGHRGIDLAVSQGLAVTAPDDAVVRFAGTVVDRPVLTLDHGGGILSSYEPVRSELPVGSTIARGAVIGAMASGGHCADGCLHVGVRVDGRYVSPLLFFARVPPAVLLPLGADG